MSSEAMTDGLLGVLFDFAYLTLAVKAGNIRTTRRELFLRCRRGFLLMTRLDGSIFVTLVEDRYGMVVPVDSWLEKDASKLRPAGSWLGMYSSSWIRVSISLLDFNVAVAQKVMDGLWGRDRCGRLSWTGSFHTTTIWPSRDCASCSSACWTIINGSSLSASWTEALYIVSCGGGPSWLSALTPTTWASRMMTSLAR